MATDTEDSLRRRPIASRNTQWAQSLCGVLLRSGIKPNHISIGSIFMAIACAACMASVPYVPWLWQMVLLVVAAVFIQLRLICNLMDGMVAMEGRIASRVGEMFNDFPDRLADAIIIVGTAYIFPVSEMLSLFAWLAAILAIITAYTRVLGVSLGAKPYFCGPMAKAHRMALLTSALIVTALETGIRRDFFVLEVALGIMIVGCTMTIYRRMMLITRELESR